MTGIASDWIQFKTIQCLISVQHQLDHFAGGVLLCLRVGRVIPLTLIIDVAKIAAPSHRSRKIIHYWNQLRIRQASEHLDVLSRLLDGFLLGRRRTWRVRISVARTTRGGAIDKNC